QDSPRTRRDSRSHRQPHRGSAGICPAVSVADFPSLMTQNITILGSSSSIGESTLDVIARHPDRYRVHALAGHARMAVLARQCQRFHPRHVVVGTAEAARQLRDLVPAATAVHHGPEALVAVAADPEVDTVMAAIVGAAGLLPTLAAVQAGKRVLLDNKEPLVMAG